MSESESIVDRLSKQSKQTSHPELSGNRNLLLEELERAVRAARAGDYKTALLYTDRAKASLECILRILKILR